MSALIRRQSLAAQLFTQPMASLEAVAVLQAGERRIGPPGGAGVFGVVVGQASVVVGDHGVGGIGVDLPSTVDSR